MKIILQWIILTLAVLGLAYLIPDISYDSLLTAVIIGALLTVFFLFIKPIIKILTLPLNVLTFGLFSIVLNGALFWFLGYIIPGFVVATFLAAIIGALVISVILL